MKQGRLTRSEKDPRGRCCPPGAGCNIRGVHQPCHLLCVEMHSDGEAIEATRFWWRRWKSLPFWRVANRKEAHERYRTARERALASPCHPPRAQPG